MSMMEKHFRPNYFAKLWGLSYSKILRTFQNEPGVILIPALSQRLGKKLKRSYFTMLIPESVAARVYERLRKK